MGIGSFLRVQWPGKAPPSTAEVKERVELYLYSPSLPSYHVVGCTLTFTVKNKLHTKSA